ARRDQKVFVAVEIDVEKNRRPRPVRGVDLGELRDLGEGAVAAIEKESVAAILRTIVDLASALRRTVADEVPVPHLMRAKEHIDNDKIIEAVAIDVGKVDAHGGEAGFTNASSGHGLKLSVAIVQPNAVGRMIIVANVKIG